MIAKLRTTAAKLCYATVSGFRNQRDNRLFESVRTLACSVASAFATSVTFACLNGGLLLTDETEGIVFTRGLTSGEVSKERFDI